MIVKVNAGEIALVQRCQPDYHQATIKSSNPAVIVSDADFQNMTDGQLHQNERKISQLQKGERTGTSFLY